MTIAKATERILHLISKVIGREAAAYTPHVLLGLLILMLLLVAVMQQEERNEAGRQEREATKAAAQKKRDEVLGSLEAHFYVNGIASARVEPDGDSVTI